MHSCLTCGRIEGAAAALACPDAQRTQQPPGNAAAGAERLHVPLPFDPSSWDGPQRTCTARLALGLTAWPGQVCVRLPGSLTHIPATVTHRLSPKAPRSY